MHIFFQFILYIFIIRYIGTIGILFQMEKKNIYIYIYEEEASNILAAKWEMRAGS